MFSKNIIFFVFEDRKIKFLKLFSIVNYIKMFVKLKNTISHIMPILLKWEVLVA